METALYILGYLLFVRMGTSLWFFAASRVLHLKDTGEFEKIDAELRWTVLVPGYLGILLDIQYNWIFGTIYFLEPPREFLFTDRLKRWKKKTAELNADSWVGRWRKHHFDRYYEALNIIDPGHV